MAQAGVSANRLELLQIADAVAREKSIDRQVVITAMEDAIQKAAKSRYGSENEIKAEVDPKTGFLRDFGEVDRVLKTIREGLDHRLLNEVEGLGAPTLENLARYIFARAREALPEVARVRIRRPSYGQACTYEET